MNNRKKRLAGRRQTGSSLILGSGIMCLIVLIGLPIIALGANYSAYIIARSQAVHMAQEAARVIDDSKYWLDLPRPDYSSLRSTAAAQAQKSVTLMARAYGFSQPQANFTFPSAEAGRAERTNCSLSVNIASRLPFHITLFGMDAAGFFPSTMNVVGYTQHQKDTQPYAVMHMDCPVPPNGNPNGFIFGPGEGPPQNRAIAVLPAFGFWHSVPPSHGVTGWYGRMAGMQGTAEIKSSEQFFAVNFGGFVTRNDLVEKLLVDGNGRMPQAVPPQPGQYISTSYLHPDSYINR